jgi:NTE family protein
MATTSFEKWFSLSQTLAQGRPGLFRPAPGVLGSLSPLLPSPSHLFDTSPLRGTLMELIDFGRLTDGPTRLLITAVDAETGEDVVFDSHCGGISVDHLMASTAFPIAFPPVHIEGKVYVDPGVSANLPIVPLFAAGKHGDVLCFAIDLVSTVGKTPASFGDAVGRAHDLIFASQSRHALRHVMLSERGAHSGGAAVVHLAYQGRDQEIGGKAFDFSRNSIRQRWAAGKADAEHMLSCRARFDSSQGCAIYHLLDGNFIPPAP